MKAVWRVYQESAGRAVIWKLALVVALGFVFLALQQSDAPARSGGVSGYSGNPSVNGGATCSACHTLDGPTAATVSISGPTTVDVGTTNTYTLTLNGSQGGGSPQGGLDVSATTGTLGTVAGQGTNLNSGEITHSTPKTFGGGNSISWSFQWTAPGTAGSATLYGVGLSTDGSGRSGDRLDTAQLGITVEEPVVNQPPTAAHGGPYSAAVSESITFDGSGSTDSDGTIVTYEWDFDGDLTYDTSTGSPTVAHSYPSQGIYNVTLRVTDDQGATDTAGTQATIGPATNQPPTANAGGPYSGTAGYPTGFDGTGSSDPEGGALTYSWDFGDGTGPGSGATPSHAYATSGNYTVTLTVTDPGGESDGDPATANIAVNQPPTADAGGPYSGTSGSPIAFSGSGSDPEGGSVTYSWDFGDGSPAGSGASPSHTYPDGNYTATLTVTDPAGADAISTAGVSVAARSAAALYAAECAGCHGANGEGGIGPSLQTSTLTLGEITTVLTSGTMAPYTTGMSSGEIAALSQFVKDMQVPPSSSTTTTTLPPDGPGLYAAKCAGCHGANGEGGIGPSLQTSTLTLGEITTVLTSGTMAPYTSGMSSAQIDALAQFTKDLQVPPTSSTTTTTLPPDGPGLYAAKCAGCHGANGEGGIGPSLQSSTLTLGEITTSLTSGSMAAFTGGMSSAQIDALAQFTRDLQVPPSSTTTTTLPPDGPGLYAAKCAGCHGANGEGGIGPSLQSSTLTLSQINASLTAGSMATFTGGMTAQQISDLASYTKDLQVSGGSTTTTTLPATDGAAIYSSKCAGCHGANAAGKSGFGPSLRTSTLSLSQIKVSLTTGSMTGFATGLSSQQIDALAAYVKSVQDPTATTTTTTLPSGLSGSALYSSQCAICHGRSGEGGAGPSMQASTMSLSQIISVVRNGSGSMGGYASKLTSDQIEAVSGYTKSLQSTTATTTTLPINAGGDVIYASQCAGCHGATGEGGLGGSLQASTLSIDDVIALVTDGTGSMPGYAVMLTPEQIGAVAIHTVELQVAGATTTTIPTGGAPLYVSYCSACHGANGEGSIGPALVGLDLSLEEFIEITRNGVGAMHGFVQRLSDEEIETLGAYLYNLGQAGSTSRRLSDITDPAELYTVGCAACHGVGGRGGIGSAVAGSPLSVQELIAVIADGAPGMPGYKDAMSAAQIGALAEFVAGLSGEASTTTPTAPSSAPAALPLPTEDGGSSTGLLFVFLALAAAIGGLAFWRFRAQSGLGWLPSRRS